MKGVYYMDDKLVNWIAELQSIAQAGLTYGKDVYDRERYQRIREITAEMMAAKIGLSLEKVTDLFCGETSYQTPKVRSEERRVGKEDKKRWKAEHQKKREKQ